MNTTRPSPTGQRAPGVLINNDYLIVLNDVIDVPLEESRGFQS